MQTNNAIYLRRRSKLALPGGAGEERLALNVVAAAVKNIESLGYGFSEKLIAACLSLTTEQFVALYEEIVPVLETLRGAHREFKPMYPNFPSQVMEMSEGELYLNAVVHYWSGGKLLPVTEAKERFPLLDDVELTMIDLGSSEDFETLFAQIAGSNGSLSEQDREDLIWFTAAYGDDIGLLLPAGLPQRENMSFVAGLLLKSASRERAIDFIRIYVKTATDVLRLAVALSEGDVSLARAAKFRTFSRPERSLLLALVDGLPNPVEDMLRWKGRWIRLGEKLHPGEHAKKFANAARAFAILRNDEPFVTFNGGVEAALAARDSEKAITSLSGRPGDFARRLDHVLRIDTSLEAQAAAIIAFGVAAHKVSTPVLLQVRQHFAVRNDGAELRVFFPKGNVARARGVKNELPALSEDICARVVHACEDALRARFAALPALGKVYVDPKLTDYTMPFALRSASKALRTLVRGSKLPLPDGEVLRFFAWWKNGDERTDLDLSAAVFSETFEHIGEISYYNLKGHGGVHSGDIVDAPDGASEFIDLTRAEVTAANVRYIAMVLQVYTRQSFVDLPECFAGWMARQPANSGWLSKLLKPADTGEIFEPKTVQDRLDLSADTKFAIPLVIDVKERQLVWCDIGLRNEPDWENNVAGNIGGIQMTLRSLVELKKPNLYDLFRLHAEARGTLVAQPDQADTVFSVENGTPFRLTEIASDYMA